MKIYFYIILLLLATACGEEERWPSETLSTVVLHLAVDQDDRIARGKFLPGAGDENEKRICRLDCYLFPYGSDENTPAAAHFFQEYSGEQTSTILEQVVSGELLSTLFPGGRTRCKVYAVANLPAGLQPGHQASVSTLKQLLLESDEFGFDKVPDQFVMDSSGEEIVELSAGEKRLQGEVCLKRAATKLSLTITSIKEVEEVDGAGNKVVWTALPDEMKVSVKHAVRRSHVDNGAYPYVPASPDDFYDTQNQCAVGYASVEQTLPGGGVGRWWKQKVPFYSYAADWRKDGGSAPYLLLVVPWHKSGDAAGSFYNCYYQISINVEGRQLLRNHFYKINLSVSSLGSFIEEKPALLQPGCVIMDWNTNTVDAELQHYRYLMVATDHVVLNNRKRVEIPYFTSHTSKIIQAECTRPDLSQNIVSSENVPARKYKLELEDHHIVFEHELNNNYIDRDFDFTPYTLTFRICHADKENYYQDVTIVQYPAIYAEADMNSDYNNDWNENNDNRHHGYTFVNGYYTDYYDIGLARQDYFASVPGYVNRKASPNMYVFTITSVKGTDYVIGDPREKEVSEIVDDRVMYNGSSSRPAWVEAPSLENGEINTGLRRLRYYYATDDSESTRNMISPKFRIASAYSVLHTNSYPPRRLDAMKKRCASYQEDGYPAGRWRLPTQAEFQFIMSQVDKGMMPELYLRGQSYWCAHGIGTPLGGGKIEMEYTGSSYYGYSTRCVYDEWYWEDRLEEDRKAVFTWGDRKR